MTIEQRRTLRPALPLDLSCTLRPLRRGFNDPTMRIDSSGIWRATRTPEGPCSTHLETSGDEILVTAWGPGAGWALERAPELVGLNDDPDALKPVHPCLRDLHRRHRGMRIGRSGAVLEAVIPSIIEQKVTGGEARRSYRRLVERYSEPAPGPGKLLLPPDPLVLGELGYYELHPLGIEKKRADTILRACRMATKLERAASMPPGTAHALLGLVPGIGPWTVAEVALVALGDVDAVSVGDYHLPNLVSWILAGEPRGDDARMLELLEPYRGQRGRAIRLLEKAGITAPRYGPRYSPLPIARL
ncbi:MAG: DNA-3-methyladenine glycosylase 2 family protein [Actinomycetota bacterium]